MSHIYHRLTKEELKSAKDWEKSENKIFIKFYKYVCKHGWYSPSEIRYCPERYLRYHTNFIDVAKIGTCEIEGEIYYKIILRKPCDNYRYGYPIFRGNSRVEKNFERDMANGWEIRFRFIRMREREIAKIAEEKKRKSELEQARREMELKQKYRNRRNFEKRQKTKDAYKFLELANAASSIANYKPTHKT